MITLNVKNGKKNVDIEFPCGEQLLRRTLGKLKMSETMPPKVYVTEVVEPRGLSILESKVLNLDEVNYLAKRMESLTKEERDKLYAIAAYEGYDEPKDLINLTFNLDEYTLIKDIGNMTKVGKQHVMTMKGGMTQEEAENTDFEKIGRELLKSGKGILTDYGMLYKNEEIEFKEVYDGQVFPQYDYEGAGWLDVEISYAGKKEYLSLPEDPIAIRKAIVRLGAPSSKSCNYTLINFAAGTQDWKNRFNDLLKRENIFDMNILVDNLSSREENLEKMTALLECAGDESMLALLKLSERLDDFEWMPEVKSYQEAGRYIIKNYVEYKVAKELENCIDYEKLGKQFMDNHQGRFVTGGVVHSEYVDGVTVEKILGKAEEIKLGEI